MLLRLKMAYETDNRVMCVAKCVRQSDLGELAADSTFGFEA